MSNPQTLAAALARIAYLEDQVAFWKDQQQFAASTAATIADLDEEAPALRQMLRTERARRYGPEIKALHDAAELVGTYETVADAKAGLLKLIAVRERDRDYA